MDTILKKAYKIIFETDPTLGMRDWQIAEKILDEFNVPKLGELAKECIFRMVNHIVYPDRETTSRIVGRAEGFASEIWDELPDEPHMNQIAWLERRFYEKKREQKELIPR